MRFLGQSVSLLKSLRIKILLNKYTEIPELTSLVGRPSFMLEKQ